MRFLIVLSVLVIPAFLGATIQDQVEKKIAESVNHSSWTMTKYHIPKGVKANLEKQSGQKFLKDFVYVWTITTPDGFYGYAIADAVKAKSAFITTMALFDSQGIVKRIDVLDYKGEHGRAIWDDHWLDQFVGKSSESTISLGHDIDAATGATYSSQAVTKGVKRWCLLAAFLVHDTSH